VARSARPKFAVFGAGFWAKYQLAAWNELDAADCVAIFNRSRGKAEDLAREFGIPRTYGDPRTLLDAEQLDFVDIITHPASHADLVRLVADRGLPVISQKPMATSFAEATGLVEYCAARSAPLFVHENFRWQRPIRETHQVLNAGTIGRPFRARVEFSSAFPVFENQPFLRTLDEFILADVGSHALDVIRFLFGEVSELVCLTDRIHADIQGEDVATILLRTERGMAVVCELSFASRLEIDAFPETLIRVEGTLGSLQLAPGCRLSVTTEQGTVTSVVSPPHYSWVDPAYEVVHASMVPCNANILAGISGEQPAETTGQDNLKTVRLVFTAYESAARGNVIRPNGEDRGSE
jgi:D-apiose dehydrogenase